jgi:EAL domain-containing protein (putative c-di-GMP-specific phosphodiesterase class I)
MHVTAEGVEHESQVAFLQEQNCDSIQGFYYSKPKPRDEYEQMLGVA